jgi:hypothetical protein
MEVSQIVESLNSEIELLTQVRNLLTGHHAATSFGYGHNRVTKKARKKRVLSAEARERIAAAQRKRWAAAKKAAK